MSIEAIQKAAKLLNSPVAALVAKACGADINKAKNAINLLTNNFSSSTSTLTNNDLARLKAGLQQLRS